MERTLRFNLKNGTDNLKIIKVTRINENIGLFHVDKIKDGYRITYSKDMIEDLKQLINIEIIRED
jgi:hypothetical protein